MGGARRTLIALAASVLLIGVLAACATQAGSITGTVTETGGIPIVGATVTAYNASGATVLITSTGDDGRYALVPLPPSVYRVEVSAATYQTRWYLEATSFATATDVVVSASAGTFADVVLPNLPPAPGSISGTVSDHGNAPIIGATVTAHDASGATVLITSTGGDGRYTLVPLPPAAYRLEVSAATYETRWYLDATSFASATDVVVSAATPSVADVVLPVAPPPPRDLRLGSAGSGFGNQLNPGACPQSQPANTAPCGPQPMMWAAINGPYSSYENGDSFATKCASGGSNGQSNKSTCDDASGTPNPNGLHAKNQSYRNTGYAYAVDVGIADVGKPLTVETYDLTSTARTVDKDATGGFAGDCNSNAAPFNSAPYTTTATAWGFQQCQTGDSGGSWNPVANTVGQPGHDINELNAQVSLFQNDGSDTSVTYGALQRNAAGTSDCRVLASAGINAATAGYKNAWKTICTFTPTQAGIFPLRVQTSGIPGVTDNGDAFNAFALRVSGGAATGLRPLDDVSTWFNAVGSTSRLYLADIDSAYAGRTLDVDLFDAGDGAGTTQYSLQLLAPPSGAPAAVPTTGTTTPCSYNTTPSSTQGPATPTPSTTCTIITKSAGSGTGIYNGRWLRLSIPIPPTYSCPSDCWWTLRYDFGAAGIPTDRLVWTTHIE